MFPPIRTLLASALLVAVAFHPAPTRAQYMYLDANGDGVHTDADVLSPSGSTTFYVWLVTDQNRDGSTPVCPVSGTSFTINSFEVLLQSVAGRVEWGTFSDRSDELSWWSIEEATDRRFYAAGIASQSLPPGRYRLGSLRVTPVSGTPSLTFLGWASLSRYPAETAFGCMCPGRDDDNTLKFESDWYDADGLPWGGPDLPPVIAPLSDMIVDEGAVAIQPVFGSDPEGSEVALRLPSGPSFASITTQPPLSSGTAGEIRLAPSFTDEGTYSVAVLATDQADSSTAFFMATVNPVNRPPVLVEPRYGRLCVERGFPDALTIRAQDPNGDSVRFAPPTTPGWISFEDHYDNSATLHATPSDDVAFGSYTISITMRDGSLESTVDIIIDLWTSGACFGSGGGFISGSERPTAAAGGPYTVVEGERFILDGSGSHQPGGGTLAYSWNFGDGEGAVGAVVEHAYQLAGTYRPILRVVSASGADRDSAQVTVAPAYAARAFVPPGTAVHPTTGRGADLGVRIEPVGGDFDLLGIDPSHGTLRRADLPDDPGVANSPAKQVILDDSDRNGIDELAISFDPSGVQRLFSDVRGKKTMDLRLTGRLMSGAHFEAPLELIVLGIPAHTGRIAIRPNPLNPAGTISFETSREGRVLVRVYDVKGRLVRTLADRRMPAGPIEIAFDGRDGSGGDLSSGVYFYRVETVDGERTGRLTILK